ncbi:MAG: AmmeMemoRadiSam system protein B, partial [Actinomycetota bacterium]|nr:AmmeMemoRadiSam system protein B [Actinomycetota bacterium]
MTADIARVRPATVAGRFYPGDPDPLRADISKMMAQAPAAAAGAPKAIIAPHAGYVYSGEVASTAFAAIKGRSTDRVVLIGPAHYVAFRGIA